MLTEAPAIRRLAFQRPSCAQVDQARLAEVLQALPGILEAEATADAAVREGARKPGFLGG